MRRLFAQVLFATAALGLTLGVVLSTAGESLFDAKAFGRRSAHSLGDPRVEAFAADRLTDAVLTASPDLTPVRPFVLATSKLIVSSEAFGAVFRTAAEPAHRAICAESTQRVVLSVSDAGVLLRSTFERASPQLVEKIPRQLEAVMLSLESGNEGVEWLRPAFELMQETPYAFSWPDDFNCRPNRGDTTAGLFQINHWIETSPTPLPSNAETVNARDMLLGRARPCERERGMLPNILAADFYRSGDLFGVVDALNSVSGYGSR